MVLAGKVNKEIVTQLNQVGGEATVIRQGWCN